MYRDTDHHKKKDNKASWWKKIPLFTKSPSQKTKPESDQVSRFHYDFIRNTENRGTYWITE